MTYIGIIVGGIAGFLYWNYIGCESGACAITSNKYISTGYGALLGSLLFSTIAGSATFKNIMPNFSGKDSTAKYQNISADELILRSEDKDFVIIDVRTPGEWKSGYIHGTDEFIDYNGSDFEEQIQKLDSSKTFILYCRSGNRSGRACEIMHGKGFKKLYNLSGGIVRWKGDLKKD